MRFFFFVSFVVALAFAQDTAYFCEVAIPNFCSGGNTPCPSTPSLTSGNDGPDDQVYRDVSAEYDFTQFNLISFGEFNGQSDIEGRLLVAGDANLAMGYSVGYKVWTEGPGATDEDLPYSLIVGGDLTWPSGALYPEDGPYNYYMAGEEFMYVYGDITAPSYLSSEAQEDSTLDASLSGAMTAGQTYYTNLQAAFAALTANVDASVATNGDFNINCPSMNETSYVISIQSTDFNRVRTYVFSTLCNTEIQYVFNILGTGSVTFSGNNIADNIRSEIILFNIVGSGRTITVSGASVRGNILAPNNVMDTTNGGYIEGFQVYGSVANSRQINRNFCKPPAPAVHPPSDTKLCPGFESDCAGLDLQLPAPADTTLFSFRDCNVISFGDFHANTGDTEGRVCVAGDFSVGAGYSVGYELSTNNDLPDRHAPASLIVGGSCTWISGAIFPAGTGVPHPGLMEGAFCGDSFSGSADLQERVVGECGSTGCLDSQFEAAHDCYNGYSSTYADLEDNVDVTVQWSGAFLTCQDSTATQYVFSITPEQMATYTYYLPVNCNFQAYWVMNVRGTSDVHFAGDFIPAPSGATLINIIGSRTVYVNEISLTGHLLAPQATLNQTGGVIIGKVVANNIVMSLQINHQNTCPLLTIVNYPVVPTPPGVSSPPPSNVTYPSSSTGGSDTGTNTGSNTGTNTGSTQSSTGSTGVNVPTTPSNNGGTCVPVASVAFFSVGDQVQFDGQTDPATITSTTDDSICFDDDDDGATPQYFYAKVSGYAQVLSSDSRRYVANPPQNSSASVSSVAFALIVVMCFFFF